MELVGNPHVENDKSDPGIGEILGHDVSRPISARTEVATAP